MRIQVVEDDVRVASFIRRGLREEQYTVDVTKDGEPLLTEPPYPVEITHSLRDLTETLDAQAGSAEPHPQSRM